MLSCFVGEDKFLKGVSLYLKERLYGNSTTADLWKGVEQATGQRDSRILFCAVKPCPDINVSEVMDAWISKVGRSMIFFQFSNYLDIQPGFPVVTVRETSDGVYLKQDRFLFTGKKFEETIW